MNNENLIINKTLAIIQTSDEKLLSRIKNLQSNDHVAKEQLKNQAPNWNERNELIYFKERLYVSSDK